MLKSLMICCLLMAALAIAAPVDEVTTAPGGPMRPCTYSGQLIPDNNTCQIFYECDAGNQPALFYCPKYTCLYDGYTYCDWMIPS